MGAVHSGRGGVWLWAGRRQDAAWIWSGWWWILVVVVGGRGRGKGATPLAARWLRRHPWPSTPLPRSPCLATMPCRRVCRTVLHCAAPCCFDWSNNTAGVLPPPPPSLTWGHTPTPCMMMMPDLEPPLIHPTRSPGHGPLRVRCRQTAVLRCTALYRRHRRRRTSCPTFRAWATTATRSACAPRAAATQWRQAKARRRGWRARSQATPPTWPLSWPPSMQPAPPPPPPRGAQRRC